MIGSTIGRSRRLNNERGRLPIAGARTPRPRRAIACQRADEGVRAPSRDSFLRLPCFGLELGGAVKFRRSGVLVLIERGLQVFHGSGVGLVELGSVKRFFAGVVAKLEERAVAVEFEVLIEGKLLRRLGTWRVPAVSPFAGMSALPE